VVILPILEPTEESEARLKELKEKEVLTKEEQTEKFNLEVRSLWNCEC